MTPEGRIEACLVAIVKNAGGEVRKVQWVGRRAAPDRLVMLPAYVRDAHPRSGLIRQSMVQARVIWVEVKAPGKAATFPADAREHAQAREHARMRTYGMQVAVVDSVDSIHQALGL